MLSESMPWLICLYWYDQKIFYFESFNSSQWEQDWYLGLFVEHIIFLELIPLCNSLFGVGTPLNNLIYHVKNICNVTLNTNITIVCLCLCNFYLENDNTCYNDYD